MSKESENHTIRLLQEMRAEMREGFAEVNARFEEVNARFDAVDLRIDGVTHMLTLLAGHSYNLEERVEKLEEKAE